MSANLEVVKLNNTFVSIVSNDDWLHDELYNLFKVEKENSNNSFSKHTHERFYGKYDGKLYLGLLPKLLSHCKNYNVTLDPALKNLRPYSREEIIEWMNSIDFPFTPYEYQYDIIVDAIRLRRLTALADTGAGKSAVLYFIVRFLVEEAVAEGREGQILLMIPNISLRSQIIKDFESYGWDEARSWCEEIIPSKSKYSNKRVVITTWQSIQNMDSEYFENFTSVLVDEAHGVSANKQYKILKMCTRAPDKIGLTGTLKGTDEHLYKVESVLGKAKTYVVTKQLQELGQAALTQVFMTRLSYPKNDLERLSGLDYMAQVDYIHMHEDRRRYLCELAIQLATKKNENILIIFEKVEKGVEHYQEYLNSIGHGDITRVVTGEVKIDEREFIKGELESSGGHIFLATWGTLSTGVNIKNLHTLIFASSTKGRIRTLQTVGRLLRVHDSKKVAKIFDFTDDTRLGKNGRSSFVEHAKERFKHYIGKEHPVNSKLSKFLSEWDNQDKYEELRKESNKRVAAKEYQKMLAEGNIDI